MNRARESTGLQQRTGPASAPTVVHEVLRTPGVPLDRTVRATWEPYFRHDFSRVRVYTGSLAAESARSVNALAYTVGRNVVFGPGRFQPGTAAGDRLLAHELTHVVQQGDHAPATTPTLPIAPADDVFERQAESAGAGAASTGLRTNAPLGLQRTAESKPGAPDVADPCAGWFRDHESMSKRAAERYVRTELGGQHGAVKAITCDLFEPNGAFACTVTFEDGTPIRVIVRPDSVVVGKFPLKSMTPPADQPLCWYAFSCPGPNRDLVLTKIKCQSAKAPDQSKSPGNSSRGPNP
jgi:hypothetical protein